ncbi:Ger(x)C family spore germination protein [Rossellomorea aquimaris]|uniref:Ger(x)C family spore germination protein n=1 Tax=Rossellomorea aquimaris TaxID=189382 RepID=UPI001CD38301|nr:Ger(x)C family spore germination protein [Rossellomorea aquimaris]MCA1054242.1 Ger(x)C family spore germination protein [Rossellomorea aquimaris]
MRKIPFFIIVMFLLAGCWDQNQLKDNRLVNGISFDKADGSDDILGTVRAINVRSAGAGNLDVKDEFYVAENKTVSQLEVDLQNKVAGNMDVGKAFIMIVGSELAETKGLTPLIEPIIRSTHGYISSRILISEGPGNGILSLNIQESPIVFQIDTLLTGGIKDGYIPKHTLFTAWNEITDPTTDIILPYIKADKADKLKLAGSALFNGDTFTGHTLTTSQTSLLLLLRNDSKKRTKISIDSDELSQPITLTVEKVKTNINVENEDGKTTCTITADFKGRLLSYYEDKSNKSIKTLNGIASRELTKQLKELTDLLLKADSDALGIAKYLSTADPESWNPDTWKQDYQHVVFKPKVTVDLIGTNNLR